MRMALQIPIKSRSERIANKNLSSVGGKPLCHWLLDRLHAADLDGWSIFIDSDSQRMLDDLSARYPGFTPHLRHPWLASDEANGNHLLHAFSQHHPGFDLYGQAFVTAPTLTVQTIRDAVGALRKSAAHDSVLLVTRETGFYWRGADPMNYNPDSPNGLPRTQDNPLWKETTGFYAVTRESLWKRGCRVGERPLLWEVERKQAVDIDTREDVDLLEAAGWLGRGGHA